MRRGPVPFGNRAPRVRVAGELGGSSPADSCEPFPTEVEAHILGGRMRLHHHSELETDVQVRTIEAFAQSGDVTPGLVPPWAWAVGCPFAAT